jgi:hypothetical protein
LWLLVEVAVVVRVVHGLLVAVAVAVVLEPELH